eukprot:COSAG05_NODE_271_length_12468_cov_8.607810_3_plen_83_part_00
MTIPSESIPLVLARTYAAVDASNAQNSHSGCVLIVKKAAAIPRPRSEAAKDLGRGKENLKILGIVGGGGVEGVELPTEAYGR